MYKNFFKPIIDFSLAFVGLLLLSPIFLVVLILLIIANQGKPFFFQRRPGKNEKMFKVIKFKTMNDKKDKNGYLLPDSERLTKVGRFIRKTSLDEIPQLLNIINGDMSLIGPRPLLDKYLPYYSDEQRKRHNIRPGITGLAQVNGRNNLEWDERFKLDVEYVNKYSFLMDIDIILKTIKSILKRKDVVVDSYEVEMDFDEYRKMKNENKL